VIARASLLDLARPRGRTDNLPAMRDPGPDVLAAVLADLPVGIWVARAPSGQAVYVNRAFERILGMGVVEGASIEEAPASYQIQNLVGQPYPIEGLPFSRVLATGGSVTVDDLVIDRGPRGKVNVRAFGAPLRDPTGAIALVTVAFIDITAETRAVAERQRAEEQLQFAVHHAPVVVWATTPEGVVTLSEGAALAAMGVRSGELVGKSIFDLYPDNAQLRAIHQRVVAGEQVTDLVDLGKVVLESSLMPVRNTRGEVVGIVGIATDVTERHQLQARMIQSDRVAAMGTLAASVAHEINNPLTFVLGSLAGGREQLAVAMRGLAEESVPASVRAALGAAAGGIAEAITAAEQIARIARDLRTFTRPADQPGQPVALDQVIGAVLRLVRKEIEARARLRIELGPAPPVRGSESRLVQVVLNLLVNAWQALPQAPPDQHEIAVRTGADGGEALIEISDTGPGVRPEDRERIFEAFFTTKEVGAGTGLGLFVCRNIVESLGGRISVGDGPGGGALFRVRLPALTGAVEPSLASEPPRAPAVAGRPRVLVIDDDEGVARILVQTLKPEFDARGVTDAREALELLIADDGIALAYCDLMMGGLSGMELFETLQERAPARAAKLVFMTGGAFTADAAGFVERQGGAVVYKPFDVLAETRHRLRG